MFLPDPQFARTDVLRVFNHAQTFLFLGAAIITVAILAARRIQQSILPSTFPMTGSFRIAARYLPMTSVARRLLRFCSCG
jgi:hypothetical protein